MSHHWLTPFKHAVLVPPRLRVLATTPTSATTARVTLRAEAAAAAFVVLESRNVLGALSMLKRPLGRCLTSVLTPLQGDVSSLRS